MEIFIATIFVTFLIIISWIDLKTLMIYDKILIPLATAGIFFDACNLLVPIEEAILNSALGFILMFVIFKISRGGMGGGDVKLTAALAFWLGEKIFSAIFFASIFAAVVALIFFVKDRNLKTKIPFAPFLSAGSLIIYFAEIFFR